MLDMKPPSCGSCLSTLFCSPSPTFQICLLHLQRSSHTPAASTHFLGRRIEALLSFGMALYKNHMELINKFFQEIIYVSDRFLGSLHLPPLTAINFLIFTMFPIYNVNFSLSQFKIIKISFAKNYKRIFVVLSHEMEKLQAGAGAQCFLLVPPHFFFFPVYSWYSWFWRLLFRKNCKINQYGYANLQ